jgi:hypothetical protein
MSERERIRHVVPLGVIRKGDAPVVRWLTARGFDGLYNVGGSCACEVGDLFPCGERELGCKPGVKRPCLSDDCPLDGRCDFHVGPKRRIRR